MHPFSPTAQIRAGRGHAATPGSLVNGAARAQWQADARAPAYRDFMRISEWVGNGSILIEADRRLFTASLARTDFRAT
jgi:hypothetical protein